MREVGTGLVTGWVLGAIFRDPGGEEDAQTGLDAAAAAPAPPAAPLYRARPAGRGSRCAGPGSRCAGPESQLPSHSRALEAPCGEELFQYGPRRPCARCARSPAPARRRALAARPQRRCTHVELLLENAKPPMLAAVRDQPRELARGQGYGIIHQRSVAPRSRPNGPATATARSTSPGSRRFGGISTSGPSAGSPRSP